MNLSEFAGGVLIVVLNLSWLMLEISLHSRLSGLEGMGMGVRGRKNRAEIAKLREELLACRRQPYTIEA